MIDREGQLETVERKPVFWRHQPGVVDQQIEPVIGSEDFVGEAPHLVEAGKIGKRNRDSVGARSLNHKAPRRLGAVPIAADHDDPHPSAGEAERGVEPDPRARPGDDGRRLRHRTSDRSGPDQKRSTPIAQRRAI